MGDVPVNEALRRLTQDPDFWSALLTDDGREHRSDDGTATPTAPVGDPSTAPADAPPDGEHPDEVRLVLPVAGGYGLVLDLDLALGEQTLGLRGPSTAEPVRLGRASPGLPYPAVLHFSELELCARVIALDDPDLPHPGLVVALLSRFAPPGPGDDPAEVAAVLQAAYRSLRRDVAPTDPASSDPAATGPEQEPLPLFAGPAWWPRPPRAPEPSGRVLDDEAIATLLTAAPAGADVRGQSRFPIHDLTELVRHARERLSKLPQEPWCAGPRVLPLARRIAGTGDLGPVVELVGTLTETGCDHPTVLDALSEPLVPAEACWMVETLAGAEPGTVLRRHLVGAARLG
jgi:hypothetical protein